ncbi:hypothetical protein FA15DRAFT_43927 [Coprinopsis marcescibilis]|uniref:Uncharacterized protein n=1 Tax=Coprinopsis marcescibilis TaxID=230819 RepID=A0A5C3L973_COPMA|nr:hypothetical protein FA15DRAFT_43927 [Coprinopsis marcescibilis]
MLAQLCVAYGKLNELDIAREIYKNITSEKATLLGLLWGHQEKAAEMLTAWSGRHKVGDQDGSIE